ncbi:unnamed protein product [Heterobilharzia americana]|nr:unnamed protein product [Heterobilharzia americana]
MVVGPRAELPWSPDRLKLLIKVFSMNEFGLQVTNLGAIGSCDCEGQVRVHINLLRPIQMLLTARPASIFDVVGTKSVDEREDEEEEEEEEENDDDHNPWFLKSNNDNNGNIVFSQQCAASNVPRSYISAGMSNSSSNEETHEVGRNVTGLRRHLGRTASRVSTFRLPRGSTKLLHVRLSTTAQMVICALLDRFGIRDNPQKFALYEHTIEGDQKVSVRKLFDDESPLGLLFRWADQDPDNFNNILSVKRLVLQENETGDIEWSTFSLSELHTFLGILNREENDYRRRIEMKYEIRRKEIKRLMDLHVKEMESSDTSISDPYSFCASHVTTVITEGYDNETATEELCDNPDPTTYSCIDSLSAPVSPTLFRKKEGQSQLKDEQSNYHEVSNSPDSGSSPELTLQHKTIRHSQLSNAISTLPRSPPTKTSEISTPNKLPSIFKSFSNFKAKKAEIAQQKRLAKLEKARIKAEQQKEQTKSHSQSTWRWRGFGTLSPSTSASISPPLPSHQ